MQQQKTNTGHISINSVIIQINSIIIIIIIKEEETVFHILTTINLLLPTLYFIGVSKRLYRPSNRYSQYPIYY